MDREIDNSNSAQTTTSLLTGHKFLEVRCNTCETMQNLLSMNRNENAYVERFPHAYFIFKFHRQPLSARRNEHERCRKQIKETWHRELKRMQESVGNLRKAKALYVQRQQEWERAKEAALRAENAAESSTEQASKLDKRKKTEEDALQKVL